MNYARGPRRLLCCCVPVQVSEDPVPELANPLLHVHVVEPLVLVLPAGHAVHDVAPALAAYVLTGQTSGEGVRGDQAPKDVRHLFVALSD